jgi:hypothetical protein
MPDMHHPTPSTDRIRELADSLGFLTEADLLLLTDWSASTAESYRKRGDGPAWVRCGSNYLYPRAGVAAWLSARVRERNASPVREAL